MWSFEAAAWKLLDLVCAIEARGRVLYIVGNSMADALLSTLRIKWMTSSPPDVTP
jgi:hypothetical protein